MNIPKSDPESKLEILFRDNLFKYIDESVQLEPQKNVTTICGTFRLDFFANHNGDRIAFECDGREFHNASRDEWRDAMILGANAVDFIYRLHGSDLFHHIEDCFYVISRWNPKIFSQRGMPNLEQLASEEAKRYNYDENGNAIITYSTQSKGQNPLYIRVERRSKFIPEGKRAFWKIAYDFALERGGGNLDEIIATYRNESCTS